MRSASETLDDLAGWTSLGVAVASSVIVDTVTRQAHVVELWRLVRPQGVLAADDLGPQEAVDEDDRELGHRASESSATAIGSVRWGETERELIVVVVLSREHIPRRFEARIGLAVLERVPTNMRSGIVSAASMDVPHDLPLGMGARRETRALDHGALVMIGAVGFCYLDYAAFDLPGAEDGRRLSRGGRGREAKENGGETLEPCRATFSHGASSQPRP